MLEESNLQMLQSCQREVQELTTDHHLTCDCRLCKLNDRLNVNIAELRNELIDLLIPEGET